jgi:hypothetical protein
VRAPERLGVVRAALPRIQGAGCPERLRRRPRLAQIEVGLPQRPTQSRFDQRSGREALGHRRKRRVDGPAPWTGTSTSSRASLPERWQKAGDHSPDSIDRQCSPASSAEQGNCAITGEDACGSAGGTPNIRVLMLEISLQDLFHIDRGEFNGMTGGLDPA